MHQNGTVRKFPHFVQPLPRQVFPRFDSQIFLWLFQFGAGGLLDHESRIAILILSFPILGLGGRPPRGEGNGGAGKQRPATRGVPFAFAHSRLQLVAFFNPCFLVRSVPSPSRAVIPCCRSVGRLVFGCSSCFLLTGCAVLQLSHFACTHRRTPAAISTHFRAAHRVSHYGARQCAGAVVGPPNLGHVP